MRYTSLLAVALLWAGCGRQERTVGLGQNIHHDDFEYTVRRVEKTDRVADRVAAGVFYLVTFEVENRARAVNHQWTNRIAYLVDERGRQYEASLEDGEQAARAKKVTFRERYTTRPGETDAALLVFDVPKDVREVYLKVRGYLLMGDVFDFDQYERTRVRLF
jgi:hypothetical protein